MECVQFFKKVKSLLLKNYPQPHENPVMVFGVEVRWSCRFHKSLVQFVPSEKPIVGGLIIITCD